MHGIVSMLIGGKDALAGVSKLLAFVGIFLGWLRVFGAYIQAD